jgi:hypothetical protein
MLRGEMPPTSGADLPVSRYSYEAVTLEIQLLLRKKGHGSKKLAAAAAQLTASQFSKRLRGAPEKFEVEHLGAIADWAKAPPGWPFVPFEHAEEMQRAWKEKRAGPRKKP